MSLRYYWDQFIRGIKPAEWIETYRVLRYQGAVNGVSSGTHDLEKYFDADGDHLSIAMISGSAPLYVRLGKDSNPFIRVREGMVLTRPFRGVTVRIGNVLAATTGLSQIGASMVAYVSHGPLINFPPKQYGIRRLPLTRDGLTADTTDQALSTFIFTGGTAGHPTLGRMGGTLIIKNTDLANTLYVCGAQRALGLSLPSGYERFPVAPGESLALQLEDMIAADTRRSDRGVLVIKTLAGTCTFALFGSSLEIDDGMLDQGTDHQPAMT